MGLDRRRRSRYTFTDELSARVEHRYTDLGDTDVDLDNAKFEVSNTFHAVRLGLSWHFGAL